MKEILPSNSLKDILSEADITLMVDTFYDKVNDDALLSPIFNDFAEVDWPHHLPKMYQFWSFVVLGIPGYQGAPFPMHARLPVGPEHFTRWLELFKANVDEHFSGANAELAKKKGDDIAQAFQYRMGLIK